MDRHRGGGDRYVNIPNNSHPYRNPRARADVGPPPPRSSDDTPINRHRGSFTGNRRPFAVIQLRKAYCHPYLFAGIEPEPYDEGELLVQDYMELMKYPCKRLDGSIRAEERFAAIRSFSRQSIMGNSNSEPDPCNTPAKAETPGYIL